MEKTMDARAGAYYFKFKELTENEKAKTIFMDADIKKDCNDCITVMRIKGISSNKLGFDKDMLFDVLVKISKDEPDLEVVRKKENTIIAFGINVERVTGISKHSTWQEVCISNFDLDDGLDLIGIEIII